MEKIDFKKEMKTLFSASSKKVTFVEVPAMKYLMVDGKGYPANNPDFQEAIEALYGMAFSLKYMLKFKKEKPDGYFDFVVPPLESLWWMDEGFDLNKPDEWQWTMMIMQADYITVSLIEEAKIELRKKKNLPGLQKLRFELFEEGKAAQMMHIGPYDQVENSISKVIKFIEGNNYQITGKHHEIYMNDPRKVAPEKLKTIVRHPYRYLTSSR